MVAVQVETVVALLAVLDQPVAVELSAQLAVLHSIVGTSDSTAQTHQADHRLAVAVVVQAQQAQQDQARLVATVAQVLK